ncbi:MAG: zinc ABC transporter substrate-binding protein [Chloroflexaceae bacterium]|nr:zinc ABC transporter substrate-binding protein [Chloroflexaceae bacterium]
MSTRATTLKPSTSTEGEGDNAEAEHEHEEEHEHEHSGSDPHVWFSPASVQGWVNNIEQTLRHADPSNADTYAARASAYREELHHLDTWISEQVALVPPDRRKLVTDHTAFGYFAHRYGFEQVGAVVPGFSTMAEPSAQELAQLEDAIRAHQVPAIFVGTTVNPSLSERVAGDTGTRLVMLYTGSLSEAGGPADTYLKLMGYDTQAIVTALTSAGNG